MPQGRFGRSYRTQGRMCSLTSGGVGIGSEKIVQVQGPQSLCLYNSLCRLLSLTFSVNDFLNLILHKVKSDHFTLI